MRKKEIKKIYDELRDKKTEILNRLMKDRINYYENLKNQGGDLADEASETIERELIYDLSITEKNEVDEIDIALRKMEEGTYGNCESCHEEIPIGRIKVKPYAKYCIKCQEIEERKKKYQPVVQVDEDLPESE